MRIRPIAGTGLFAAFLALTIVIGSSSAAPVPFAAVSPDDHAHLPSQTPTLTWNRSSSGAGSVQYTAVIDDQPAGVVDDAACPSTCSFTPGAPLSEAGHAWKVVAHDVNGDTETETRQFTVDVTPPTVLSFSVYQPSLTKLDGTVFHNSDCPEPRIDTTDHAAAAVTYTLDGLPFPDHITLPQRLACNLSEGAHTLVANVRDQAGNKATATLVFRTDLVKPALTLQGPAHSVKGATQSFRAVVAPGTAVPPVTYFWNVYTNPFTTPFALRQAGASDALRIPFTFTTARLEVTAVDAEGDLTTAVLPLASGPKPPRGAMGVTIDGGPYRNHRRSTLHLIWPAGATRVTITNPANGHRQTLPVSASIPWTLAGSGRSRTFTTVRVRFDWPTPARTYSTRVMVDTQPPKLSTAAAVDGTLRLNAADTGSGLAKAQLASRRSHPAKPRQYGSTLRFTSARWVRVIDRAGNRSAWHRIKGM
jgi:hypothetical protein